MQTQSSSSDIASTQKLSTRVSANSNASRDFDEWCFRQLPELPLPARVLDLGAGTGKQLHLFSPILSPNSEIFALDLSEESLTTLSDKYSADAKLTTITGSFDEMEELDQLEAGSFDLIYASYALYYTKDLPALMDAVHRLLKPGGCFWMIGPYRGTNKEFLDLLRPLHEVEDFMDYVFDRFPQEVIANAERLGFRSMKPAMLRNQVHFPDEKAFLTYLSNSLFYRAGHDEAILEAVQKICSREGSFRVSKNIVSLQFRRR